MGSLEDVLRPGSEMVAAGYTMSVAPASLCADGSWVEC